MTEGADMPVRPVLVFRSLLAAWLLAHLVPRLPHLEELYCRPVLREDALRHLGLPPPPLPVVAALFAGALGGVAAVGVGRWPRVGWALAFPCLVAILALSPESSKAYGALATIQFGLLWFAPFDAPATARARAWPAQLLVAQWSSVYALSVAAKLSEAPWREGSALFYALNGQAHGQWLLSAGGIGEGPAQLLTWAAMAGELAIALGIWGTRTRGWAAAACVALHLGVGLTMRITPLFALLMWLHLPLALALPTGGERPRRPAGHQLI